MRGMPARKPRKYIQQVMVENFLNYKKDIPIKVEEPHRTSSRLYQKGKSPSHIVIKTLNRENRKKNEKL